MTAAGVAHLRIKLNDVEPTVARRVEVPLAIRLDRLHLVLQAAIGWSDSHLYEFRARDIGWGVPDPDFGDGPLDACKARLVDVVQDTGVRSLEYLYDFGDGWEHTIRIERITDAVPGITYPRLIQATGRCPPEDVGGPWGYRDVLAAIADPDHEQHAETLGSPGHSIPRQPMPKATLVPSRPLPRNGHVRHRRAANGPTDQRSSPEGYYSVNTRYVFDRWSDGGALSHEFTVPTGASTIAGTFTAQYVPIAYASPSCAAAVSLTPTSLDGFYSAGTAVTVAASAASGWDLTGWTGDLSGRRAVQRLVVADEELAVANHNTSATPFKLSALSPGSFVKGGAGGTVKIKGTGFSSASAVFVNNAYCASTFVGPSLIEVSLTASDLAAAGAFPIGVSNFPAGADCGAYGALGFFVRR